MEVKELVELLGNYALREGQVMYALIYSTGNTCLASRMGIFTGTFQSIKELEQFLKKEQKPLDYKSLFSVVDDVLHFNRSKIDIMEANVLPLTWTKWVVRGEAMNELGKIITSSPGESITCACCILYHGCVGCPIMKHTGLAACEGTPFIKFHKAWRNKDLFTAMKANERMEEFLKSLMEEQK